MPAEPAPAVDPQAFPARIGAGRTRTELRRRQIVLSQGDPADTVFYLAKGKIGVQGFVPAGQGGDPCHSGSGDFFGEGRLVGQRSRTATAAAATKRTVVRIGKSAMVAALRDVPDFAALFLAHPLSRNIRLEEDLVDQLFNSSEKRLARVLPLLADIGKDGKPEAVVAKISQESLADMLGTTRSRVSYFHEQIPQAGVRRLQSRRAQRLQLAA